jgi:hypothetical protein
MIQRENVMLLAAIVVAFLLARPLTAQEILLEDTFEFFELGETWQEHAAGVPDVTLAADAGILQMASSGVVEDFYGIETITSISIAGLTDLTVDARLQPINQGVEGSIAAAEVAVIGDSGVVMRAFASNNAGPDPASANDWADHYEDNLDNLATSGPWIHCDSNGGPACDAMRNLVLRISDTETTIEAWDDYSELDGFPRWEATIDDVTIADLGTSVTIALRQLAVDGGDTVMGFFDRVAVTSSGTPVTVLQAGDADQDLDFDQLDLVQVQIAGKYLTGQVATWGDGDWDGAPGGVPGSPPTGDGVFDQRDIIAALAADHYLTGPYAVARPGQDADPQAGWGDGGLSAGSMSVGALDAGGELGKVDRLHVPEPASRGLLSLGMLAVCCAFRRRRGRLSVRSRCFVTA